MAKIKLSKKQELNAEIRNRLSLPLTVLSCLKDGKSVPKKSIELAIKELEAILKIL